MRILLIALSLLLVGTGLSGAAMALDLTQRKVTVDSKLNVSAATKVADKLIAFDAQADAPITLMISATEGSAQGVQLLADTIRSLKSPVVAAVITQVHGAGAALATFTDRVLVYPSAGFVFTELPYEGVNKPKKPEPKKPAAEGEEAEEPKPPEPEEVLLQAARTAYLDRFNARLAKRIHWKAKKLAKKMIKGGFIVNADEAVRMKIADAVVESITYTTLPETKRETKITTTDKRSRAVPAP
ncbi:MAG: ATP-dependent Clp protease proteolytic subunit [Myxococcota bacterium]